MTQYSIRPKPSATVHKLFTSCMRRCLVSRACDWVMSALSAALLIFSFQFSLRFFHISVAIAASALRRTINFDTQYRALDVVENLAKYLSCAERTSQGKDFELILTVKVETRHPVEGQFGSEFSAICNHCVVMTAWSRKTWKFCEQVLRCFGKRTPYGNIFKILFGKFSPPHQSTLLCWHFVKFIRREIGKIVRRVIYQTKTKNKISAASQTVVTARIAPKICQGQPQQCSHGAPDFIQIGSISAELLMLNAWTPFFAP